MIIKATRWNCVCEKCGNAWTTRSATVSKACPGCKSWTWNSETTDYDNSTDDKSSYDNKSISTSLAELGVTVGLVETEPDEWEGWSDEKEEYDGQSGETIIYRKKLVKPFNIVEIRREH